VAAYCTRAKRFPDLKRLLDKTKRRPKVQSMEEQLQVIKMINAAYSGKKER
jgi:hypothetical protein